MKKHILKIMVSLLIILLPGVGTTGAYFSSNASVINNTATAGWWIKPSVAVISPNGGEIWTVGSIHDITWTAVSSDPSGTINTIDILLSTDGGTTYPTTLISGIANTGSYSWTISNPKSMTMKVKIVATDNHGLVGSDESDNIFDPVEEQILISTPTPNEESESTPTPTPTPIPNLEVIPTPTPESTPIESEPTLESSPDPSPTPSPEVSPTPELSPTPAPIPVESPTPELSPTPSLSPSPVSSPSPEPSPEVSPSPTPESTPEPPAQPAPPEEVINE